MLEIFFWKSWTKPEKWLASLMMALPLALGFYGLFLMHDAATNIVGRSSESELYQLPTTIDKVLLNQWQFGVSVPSYLVAEYDTLTNKDQDSTITGIGLAGFLIGLSIILAASTALPRLGFLGIMSLFMLLAAISKTEALGITPLNGKLFLTMAVGLFGGFGYYFHAFRASVPIIYRVVVFLLISLLLVFVVFLGSPLAYKGDTFLAYSYPAWLVLGALFFLSNSLAIISGLVWLASSHSVGSHGGSFSRFLFIAGLYLIVLTLIFLQNGRLISLDIFWLNPALLGAVAALLGTFILKQASESRGAEIYFRESLIWIYLGLFAVSASLVIILSSAANDPGLEVIEDFIINGQLGMSLVFVFYVLANFYPLFRKGLAVHKVLFKPLRFTLANALIIGLGAVAVLFSVHRGIAVRQAVAGYYNALGDISRLAKEDLLAERYYETSLQQEFQNHKANFSLALMAREKGNDAAAAYYFRQATLKNPSPQAYLGLAEVLRSQSQFFDGIFTLRDGLRVFPNETHLANNLGLLHSKTSLLDSAVYYLQQAGDRDIPLSNALFLYAHLGNPVLADSLARAMRAISSIGWQANRLALKNALGKFPQTSFDIKSIPRDSILSRTSLAYVYNYGLNQHASDTSLLMLTKPLAEKNPFDFDDLYLISAYKQFYGHNVSRGLETMTALAHGGEKAALCQKILGNWFLKLGLYTKALEAFSKSPTEEGVIGKALTVSLLGNKFMSASLLDSLGTALNAPQSFQDLKKNILSASRGRYLGDSLLTEAKSGKNLKALGMALTANPYHEEIVSYAVSSLEKQGLADSAYRVVVNALAFNDQSPHIWEEYAMLSLGMGLTNQAEEGRLKVERLREDATDYQVFLKRYQPKKALIEKERAEFR